MSKLNRVHIVTFIFTLFISLLLFVPSPKASEIETGLSDDELLEIISRKAFDFFTVERNPTTGLVKDRANNFQRGASPSQSSIASTGFALTAYGVAVERGWMDRDSAREITRRTLTFFLNQAAQEHGFFYHFLDMETGERSKHSELSPIDTALFLAGAMFAAEYFDDEEIRGLTQKIYERVDWPWMLHDGPTLAMAWSPEEGFSKLRWDHYNESMIMQLQAVGSPTHPIPAESWKTLARPVGSYKGYRVIQMPPLFTHQYSHIWIDFKDKNDGFADYFQNSVNASLANRAFCIDQAAKFQTYGENSWGLTAADGPFGYHAYGAPPGWAEHDGTIAPTGCGSSIVFTPKESIACLRHFYEDIGEKIWGAYGFSDSFNVDKDWYDKDVIGIDQGALLLMIENYRSGLIWKTMAKNEALNRAMKAVGFVPGTKALPWPEQPVYHAPYVPGGIKVDGYLKDWPSVPAISIGPEQKESGAFTDEKDLKGEIRFAWDERVLYFAAEITDDDVLARKSGKNIWQDDLLEIYIDPAGDGLFWYGKDDLQLGFSPREKEESVASWSWFQGGEDPQASGSASAAGYTHGAGYVIEGAIRWNYIGVRPEAGMQIALSPAIHDIDRDRSGGKLQWFFRNEEAYKRFVLGKIILAKDEVKKEKAA